MTRQETLFGLLLWFAILSANLFTATRSPTVWHDEVYFADPAIHFAEGDGFRTTAWTLVPEDKFWPGLAPAYGFLLGTWLKLAGVELWQVRALPILLAAVAALWVWWTARRHRHVASAAMGWFLLAALLCGSGVSFSYRSGRGDALAMLWWAATYAGLASPAGHLRSWSLFLLGAVAPWCGAYLAPTIALAGIFLILLFGRQWLGPVLSVWAGFAAGLLCMIGLYWHLGSWDTYVTCVRYYQNGILSPQFELRLNGFRDPGLIVVALGLALCVVGITDPKRRIAIYALGAVLCIGLLQALSAKWPVYYTWLAFFPALLALAHVMPAITSPLRKFVMPALACVIVTGLPARLGVSMLEWGQRDHQVIEEFATGKFRADDWVVCDPSAYFALRPLVHVLYPRAVDMTHEINADTKRSITAVCVRSEVSPEKISSIFGGKWTRIASLGDRSPAMKFGEAAAYRLVAYRRMN